MLPRDTPLERHFFEAFSLRYTKILVINHPGTRPPVERNHEDFS